MSIKLKNVILVCIVIFLFSGIMVFCIGCSNNLADGQNKLNNYLSKNLKEYPDLDAKDFNKENISFYFEGNKLNLNMPIYVNNNRYYLPLTEIIKQINGKIRLESGTVYIEVNNFIINLNTKDNYFIINDFKYDLKKNSLVVQDIVYISLFDLKRMLNLEVNWDEEKKTIGLFWDRTKLHGANQPSSGKNALLRFEDVTADQRYSTAESLEKLRVIFDYCHSRNIPMHLCWTPRFIDKKNNIDNAPAQTYNIHNANFVYTLDYFTDKNGLIGLHGYTHQFGDELSISGTELSGRNNTSEKSVRQILENAINDAKKLEIPISFFESPHYAATPTQKKIIEQYFDNIYEYQQSFREKNITKVTVGNRTVKYIPTPLNYLNGKEDTNNMINKIKALNAETLGSFFFHPSIEFDFITLKKDTDGYTFYEYSDYSPLHRIINTFIESGYSFKDINSI